MELMLSLLVGQGSLVLVMLALLAGASGIPLPEDLLLMFAGVLSHRTGVPLALTIVGCAIAVLAGNLTIFRLAGKIGRPLLCHPFGRRIVPPRARQRFERLLERHGSAVVLIARLIPGLRTTTFALLGMHGLPLRRFVLWDALGLCITVPLMVALGHFGSSRVELARTEVLQARHVLVWVAIGLVALLSLVGTARMLLGRPTPRVDPASAAEGKTNE